MQRIPHSLLLTIALLAFTPSCRTKVKVVEVERIRTEHQRQVAHRLDSVHQLDSTRLEHRGETIYYERWRTKTREILRIDTLHLERIDSIRYPVVVEVEKPSSWLSKAEMWAYRIALVALALYCALLLLMRR